MTLENPRLSSLVTEAIEGRYSRRDIVRRGVALGLAAPAIGVVLSRVSAASVAAQEGPVKVSIVNKEMTHDEIAEAVKAEGTVNVGNWTYTANDTFVAKFQEYVKNTYGADIKLNYAGEPAAEHLSDALYTPPCRAAIHRPYDVMAIEEPYWQEAQSQPEPVMQEYLPSGLIPNADRVLDVLKHEPTAIGFQASATPAIVYDKQRAGFLEDWTDLADERLKGKVTAPLSGRHHLLVGT